MPFSRSLVLAAVLGVTGAAAHAEAHIDEATQAALKARQSHMQLYAHNLGIIGGMARGNMEYDAEMAATAAADLLALAEISEQAYWPEGSDNSALGDATRALPTIWEDPDGFAAARAALVEAATSLAETAGTGPDGLAGLRAVGGACGACHERFQESG